MTIYEQIILDYIYFPLYVKWRHADMLGNNLCWSRFMFWYQRRSGFCLQSERWPTTSELVLVLMQITQPICRRLISAGLLKTPSPALFSLLDATTTGAAWEEVFALHVRYLDIRCLNQKRWNIGCFLPKDKSPSEKLDQLVSSFFAECRGSKLVQLLSSLCETFQEFLGATSSCPVTEPEAAFSITAR